MRPVNGRCRRCLAVLTTLMALAVDRSSAQAPPESRPPEATLHGIRGTTPHLAPDHWALAAARRAELLGLLDRPLPPRRSHSIGTVGAALRSAADRAARSDAATMRLALGWQQRFEEEFPRLEAFGREPAVISAGASAGLRSVRGAAEPGMGEFEPSNTGATPLDDTGGLVVGGYLAASLGPHVGLLLEPRIAAGGAEIPRFDVGAGLGPLELWVGRQPVGYGPVPGWGLVLSGDVPLDRVEVRTERAVRLPGVLRHLGPTSFGLLGSRLAEPRHEREPYFWAGTFSIAPHPRLLVSVQRAAMFGGEGEDLAVTPGRVARMLVGQVANYGFEDQVVSLGARLRLPTETVLPLAAFMEWGAEDAAGSWWDVPGRVFGLETAAFPAIPVLSAGIAYSSFGGACCGNPAWYRHAAFPGAWAYRELPLGHPLGGHGRELLAHGSVDALDARLRVSGRAFRRQRHTENLYVPGRPRSLGGAVAVRWRPVAGADLRLEAAREAGTGWAEESLRAGIDLFF